MDKTIHANLISRCSWQVLILGVSALLVFPETFASSELFGQTWLWLTAMPLSVLLVIHRHRFATAWSAALVSSPSRRRRPVLGNQARRKGFGHNGARHLPQRAA